MSEPTGNARRRAGRGIRPWLLLAKLLGLTGFLGGLASMTAMGLLGPRPDSLAEWQTVRALFRSMFFPCFFGGLMLTIAAGVALYLQHPGVFVRLRWFRLKVALLVLLTPVLHIWARTRMGAFDRALEVGRLDELPGRWDRVTTAFAVSLAAYLLVGAIGRIKPRLGEPPGSRR
ncbi:MAG: hypothetical protein ACYTJ0_15275 [Planctomycetota bacterium]|jgi:hypothetical protein